MRIYSVLGLFKQVLFNMMGGQGSLPCGGCGRRNRMEAMMMAIEEGTRNVWLP